MKKLYFSLFFNFIFLLYILGLEGNCQIKNILKWIAPLCSVAVIITTVIGLNIAKKNYTELLKQHEKAQQEKKDHDRMYNFRKFLMESRFSEIDNFFEHTEVLVKDFKNIKEDIVDKSEELISGEIKDKLKEYTEIREIVFYKFVDVATPIDEVLGKELAEMFELFQDDFTDAIDKYISDKLLYKDFKLLINEQRNCVFKTLLNYK